MREMTEAAGRDPDEIEVSIYFAPTDPAKITEFAEAGVHRLAFDLPSVDGESAIAALDDAMGAVEAAGLQIG